MKLPFLNHPRICFLAGWLVCSLFWSTPAMAKAPWFENQNCVDKEKVEAYAVADGYRYDASGKIVQSLWDTGLATCHVTLRICGDKIFKSKEINTDRGERCPPEFDGYSYSNLYVCCDEWKRAKHTNNPCNPLTDADCDGIANQEDSTPTEAGPVAEPPPPITKGGKELHADLRVIIQAPHQFPLGVTPFALIVKNYGPGSAPNVRLNGSAGLGKLIYATTSQGNCTVSETSLNCEFDSIQSGDSRSVSVQLRTETEGEARITADVTGGATDLVTENNHAEHNITVKKAIEGTLVPP